jgi:hypothetical protein
MSLGQYMRCHWSLKSRGVGLYCAFHQHSVQPQVRHRMSRIHHITQGNQILWREENSNIDQVDPKLTMEPQPANLCKYCTDLFPLQEQPSASRAHYSNVALLEKSSETCQICRVILPDLQERERRFRDTDRKTIESMSFKVTLSEIQKVGSALSWARLSIRFKWEESWSDKLLSVTACTSECELTFCRIYVIFAEFLSSN